MCPRRKCTQGQIVSKFIKAVNICDEKILKNIGLNRRVIYQKDISLSETKPTADRGFVSQDGFSVREEGQGSRIWPRRCKKRKTRRTPLVVEFKLVQLTRGHLASVTNKLGPKCSMHHFN
jgi:hypothetical protein